MAATPDLITPSGSDDYARPRAYGGATGPRELAAIVRGAEPGAFPGTRGVDPTTGLPRGAHVEPRADTEGG